jgi:UDP-N-acetylmuramyl pentapeptide phosphotransferase/UDP-N-acetylglucosamine-1-phosphate transferase
MNYYFAYLVLSIFFVYTLTKSTFLLNYFIDEHNQEPQKVHVDQISRNGGIIYILLVATAFFFSDVNPKLLIYMIIFLFIGLAEDFFQRVKASIRFILIGLLSLICVYDLGFYVNSFQIPIIDQFFQNYITIQFIFTAIALCVAVNAYNIIDGFNGLLLGVAIIGALILFYVIQNESSSSYIINSVSSHGNIVVLILFLISTVSILLFNFPNAKIFSGDGGAYAIGYFIGIISIIEFNNLGISAWFFSVILCYPMIELFVSFCRRIFLNKKHAFSADFGHLHSMIFLIIRGKGATFLQKNANPLTSVVIWFFYLFQTIPTIIIYKNELYLKLNFLFCLSLYFLLFIMIRIYCRKNKLIK